MLSLISTPKLLLLAAAVSLGYGQNLDADMIQTMGNNSLFNRWRPTSRFIAPAGWMNDPCGAMYDPTEETYHLFYQWHPNHVNWGNISWGHATSKDLVTWTDVGGWENGEAEALVTGEVGSYNGLGIFSGTAQPVNLQGEQDGTLLLFYTSVSKLPTNWRLPYLENTETQSIAISNDGGQTWQDYENNPIIDTSPEGWNITGWRDPFVEPWPEMDALLGQSEPHYYAVLGSGIKEVGPRIPFYSAPASDLTNWTFHGALWEPEANASFGSPLETGTWAYNFEVSAFFSLEDEDGDLHYYLNMGSEGGNTTYHPRQQWALWNEGIVTKRENGSAAFTPVAGGAGDWGLLYALTNFHDTRNNRRVLWGWANEEMGDFAINQQGFQGAFGLPRELFVVKTRRVVNYDGGLTTAGNNRLTQNSDGTFTATTLGQRPLPDVVAGLRNGSQVTHFSGASYDCSQIWANGSNHLELVASFRDVQGGPVGLTIAASPDEEEITRIIYSPSNYTITVDRSSSSTITQFVNASMVGYFYPYNISGSGVEDINMHVFLDGSLLEIFVNDRFALTSRIYPSREDSTGFGVYISEGASAYVDKVSAWTGHMNAWPERLENSSSALVFDTAEQTNNYTWWPGN